MYLGSMLRRYVPRSAKLPLRYLRDLLTKPKPLFELPELVEKPAGSTVVVVAPHPDDETFGCGGTLYKHYLAGDRVTVVFMTDGAAGDNLANGVAGQALVALREQEARAAATTLGIAECIFLRNSDASLELSPKTVAQLRRVLESSAPDVVYAPSPLETHRDHRQGAAITAHALADFPGPVQVYLYEIWAPVPANCAVPIDLDHKISASRIYRSQMDSRELYITAVTGLARYRGIMCAPGQDLAIECFLRLDRAAFLELVHDVG